MSRVDALIKRLCPDGIDFSLLGELEDRGTLKLGRGNVISKKDIAEFPGNYPVYSSSAAGVGEFGRYGKYMFDDERISWSVDGGGRFFYRPAEKYSVTNVSGWLKVNDAKLISTKYLFYVLDGLWQTKNYDYTKKAHPSVIRNEYRVPVPPLEVQQEIVNILDTFTQLEAELEAELEARKKQYEYYLNILITPNQEFNYTLGDLLDKNGYIRGPFGSSLRKADMVENGIPVYEQQHAIYGHRNFRYFIAEQKANALSRFMVKPGDLIISCSGTVGKSSIIDASDQQGIINQALLILRVNTSVVLVKYLQYLLDSSYGKASILTNTKGGAQVNISSRENFAKTKLYIPPLTEQRRIVSVLDKFSSLLSDVSEGLPAELYARRKQYEYYRNKLLTFKELQHA